MKTKQYKIEITTNAPKTIAEMREQLKLFNEEIENVAVGSEEFNSLTESIQDTEKALTTANKQIKGVDETFKGLNLEQKSKAFADVAGSIVGGFSLASQTIGLFSSSSGKAFEESTKRALGYIQALQGIQNIAKGFSGDSIKLFQSLKGGFTQALASAKTFSTGTKAALAATGIGLLIVAVGLLVANFEKLKEVFSGVGESAAELDKKTQASIASRQAAYQGLLNELNNELRLLELQGATEDKLFSKKQQIAKTNAALKKKELEDQERVLQLLIDEQVAIAESSAIVRLFKGDLDEARKATEEKTLEVAKLRNEYEALADTIGVVAEEEQKLYDDNAQKARESALEREISKLTALGNKDGEIYAKRKAFYNFEIRVLNERIKKGEELNFQDAERLKNLKNQSDILTINENRRLQLAKIEELRIDTEIQGLEEQYLINQKIEDLKARVNNIPLPVQEFRDLYKEIEKLSNDAILSQQQNLIQSNAQEVRAVEERVALGILSEKKGEEEILKLRNSSALASIKIQETIYKQNEDTILNSAKAVEEQVKRISTFTKDTTSKDLAREINSLNRYFEDLKTKIGDFLNESGKFSEAQVFQSIGGSTTDFLNQLINPVIAELNTKLNEGLASFNFNYKASVKNLTNDLSSLKIGDVIQLANGEFLIFNGTLDQTKKKFQEIQPYGEQIGVTIDDTTRKTYTWLESLKLIKQQQEENRREAELNGETYQVIIEQATAYAMELANLVSSASDLAMAASNARLKDFEDEFETASEKLEDLKSNAIDYEALLKDAAGERRDAIIAEQAAQNAAILEQQKLKEDAEKKINAEKRRQAKIQRNADIVQSIVNTAVAVTKALPNFILAGIVAAAGALQVAAIAKQPLPEFADGGFIGEGITKATGGVDGTGERKSHVVQLHADEYVVPRRVMQTKEGQGYVSALESMRKKSMADGGSVGGTPNVMSKDATMLDMFKQSKFVVSVVDFENVRGKLVQARDTASI